MGGPLFVYHLLKFFYSSPPPPRIFQHAVALLQAQKYSCAFFKFGSTACDQQTPTLCGGCRPAMWFSCEYTVLVWYGKGCV